MARLGRAHGRHAVRQLVRLLQLDQCIEIDSDNIAVGEPARNWDGCVWEGCFVGKPCQARPCRAGESSACTLRGSRRTPVLPRCSRGQLHSPAAAGASSSDLRTLPTMSTLFCNQRKPVIDP